FLPNPYYEKDLKFHTGTEEIVQRFVYQDGNAEIFLHKLKALLDFLIPLYISEGKNQLVIGIACTGGKHRSVTIAEKLYQSIKDMENIGVRLDHRDINK
ncbi:MAG: RNase adaptor protein RapZ, partial [Oribacterium parvum]|nr:RNase adaptor protein RapZ [Oribacterium parvum]